jgi:hypothetical protein
MKFLKITGSSAVFLPAESPLHHNIYTGSGQTFENQPSIKMLFSTTVIIPVVLPLVSLPLLVSAVPPVPAVGVRSPDDAQAEQKYSLATINSALQPLNLWYVCHDVPSTGR